MGPEGLGLGLFWGSSAQIWGVHSRCQSNLDLHLLGLIDIQLGEELPWLNCGKNAENRGMYC